MTSKLYPRGHSAVRYFKYTNGQDIYTSQTFLMRIGFTDQQIGTDLPSYRRYLALAEPATNALSRIDRTITTLGDMDWKVTRRVAASPPYPAAVSIESVSGPPEISVAPQIDSTAFSSKCTGKILDRLREHRQKFSSGVFIGELRETLQMIRKPAKTLRESLDSYLTSARKSRRRAKSRRLAEQSISDSYLEYAYGWAPLTHDIADGYNAYLKLINEPITTYRIRASVSGKLANSVDPVLQIYGASMPGMRSVRDTQKVKVHCVIGLTETRSHLLSNTLGLDPFENFLPDVYNLLPWTFLIDYFTNLGSVLEQSCTSVQGVKWGSKTTVTSSYRDIYITPLYPTMSPQAGNFISFSGSGVHNQYLTRTITRADLRAIDLRASNFTFRFPGIRQSFNIAALILGNSTEREWRPPKRWDPF